MLGMIAIWGTIDIHGGGLDLIFHENEIARADAPTAGCRSGTGYTTACRHGRRKMSKSLGNIITPAELLARA
jgi:cysteinyl-tRNA synthetase